MGDLRQGQAPGQAGVWPKKDAGRGGAAALQHAFYRAFYSALYYALCVRVCLSRQTALHYPQPMTSTRGGRYGARRPAPPCQ